MRIRRRLRSVSAFLTQVCAALLKAAITSAILGVFLVIMMHYMGVPVPSARDLLGGFSRLAHVNRILLPAQKLNTTCCCTRYVRGAKSPNGTKKFGYWPLRRNEF